MNTVHVKITHYPDSHCECCGWNSYKELSITCGGDTVSVSTNKYVQNNHWGGDWDGSNEELYQFILEAVLGDMYLIVDFNSCYEDGAPYEFSSDPCVGYLDTDPLRLVLKDGLQYLVVNGKTYVTLFPYNDCSMLEDVVKGMVWLLGYTIEIEEEWLE